MIVLLLIKIAGKYGFVVIIAQLRHPNQGPLKPIFGHIVVSKVLVSKFTELWSYYVLLVDGVFLDKIVKF